MNRGEPVVRMAKWDRSSDCETEKTENKESADEPDSMPRLLAVHFFFKEFGEKRGDTERECPTFIILFPRLH